MAALGAAELTSQMQAMQADMSQMQQTLNAIMPKIDEGIQTSQQIATDIDKKLAEHVNPIVAAKVIDTIVRLTGPWQQLSMQGLQNSKLQSLR